MQLTILTHNETQLITNINEAEHRLQQVIAISTAPGDMQKQIELGRRQPADRCLGFAG